MLFNNDASGVLLVVAPHADDEVLGAGGLIIAAVRAGWRVCVLFMSAAGFHSQSSGNSSSETARLREAKAACTVLGVSELRFFSEGNANHLRFDTIAQVDLVASVERAIAEFAPSVVAVPSSAHFHQDHRAVAAACETAMRPAPSSPSRPQVPIILAYGHGGGDWSGTRERFAPTTFVLLDDIIDQKLAALACYASQVQPPPHGRSLDSLRAWHRHWGTYIGATYAEPFETSRCVV